MADIILEDVIVPEHKIYPTRNVEINLEQGVEYIIGAKKGGEILGAMRYTPAEDELVLYVGVVVKKKQL